jgi:hypothetical protein
LKNELLKQIKAYLTWSSQYLEAFSMSKIETPFYKLCFCSSVYWTYFYVCSELVLLSGYGIVDAVVWLVNYLLDKRSNNLEEVLIE